MMLMGLYNICIQVLCLYLCVVFRTREERQLIGSREVCSDLLHLTKTLPFPPFCPPVLEPHLAERKKAWMLPKETSRWFDVKDKLLHLCSRFNLDLKI